MGPQLLELRLNGNMLIFDEEMRRTDISAAIGGIGDMLEIDLLSSRDFSVAGETRDLNRMGVKRCACWIGQRPPCARQRRPHRAGKSASVLL